MLWHCKIWFFLYYNFLFIYQVLLYLLVTSLDVLECFINMLLIWSLRLFYIFYSYVLVTILKLLLIRPNTPLITWVSFEILLHWSLYFLHTKCSFFWLKIQASLTILPFNHLTTVVFWPRKSSICEASLLPFVEFIIHIR